MVTGDTDVKRMSYEEAFKEAKRIADNLYAQGKTGEIIGRFGGFFNPDYWIFEFKEDKQCQKNHSD